MPPWVFCIRLAEGLSLRKLRSAARTTASQGFPNLRSCEAGGFRLSSRCREFKPPRFYTQEQAGSISCM